MCMLEEERESMEKIFELNGAILLKRRRLARFNAKERRGVAYITKHRLESLENKGLLPTFSERGKSSRCLVHRAHCPRPRQYRLRTEY